MVTPHPRRYLISRQAVKEYEHRLDPGKVVRIHDTEHLSEQCNTDDIKSKSYFSGLQWAINKGYRPCEHCMRRPE